ncbi:MAG: hypothetical protein ACLQIK_05095, partial [Mycobacterium sp.]
ESSNENAREAGRSLLDEIVRDGARQMLAAALAAEVAAYIDAFADHQPIPVMRRGWRRSALNTKVRKVFRRGMPRS